MAGFLTCLALARLPVVVQWLMRRASVRLTAAGTVQDFHLASLSNFPKKILTIKSAAKLQFFFDCSGSVKIFSNQPTIHCNVLLLFSWAARLLAIPKGRGAAHGLLYSLYPLFANVAVGLSAFIALALPWALSRQGASSGRSLRPSALSRQRCAQCRLQSLPRALRRKIKKGEVYAPPFRAYPGPGSNRHECYLIGF